MNIFNRIKNWIYPPAVQSGFPVNITVTNDGEPPAKDFAYTSGSIQYISNNGDKSTADESKRNDFNSAVQAKVKQIFSEEYIKAHESWANEYTENNEYWMNAIDRVCRSLNAVPDTAQSKEKE